MEMPCDNCLLVPICRQKNLFNLLNECEFIDDYLYERGKGDKQIKHRNKKNDFQNRAYDVVRVLNPIRWTYRHTEKEGDVFGIKIVVGE